MWYCGINVYIELTHAVQYLSSVALPVGCVLHFSVFQQTFVPRTPVLWSKATGKKTKKTKT